MQGGVYQPTTPPQSGANKPQIKQPNNKTQTQPEGSQPYQQPKPLMQVVVSQPTTQPQGGSNKPPTKQPNNKNQPKPQPKTQTLKPKLSGKGYEKVDHKKSRKSTKESSLKMRRPKAFNFDKTVKFVSPQPQQLVDVSVGKKKDTADVWMHLRAINVKLIKKE